jgi:hypothetical protein
MYARAAGPVLHGAQATRHAGSAAPTSSTIELSLPTARRASSKLNYFRSVDQSTYRPEPAKGRGMGALHPISGYQSYEGGRAFYTAPGRMAATYRDPVFLHHLDGGIYWAATGRQEGKEVVADAKGARWRSCRRHIADRG